ncbi:hypothetical protein Q0F98_24425 [Paenibacillus amylolyticus]|nr:hypothetical protein Q0F98_24425 [Paenibacillus amylolyticus]
MDRRLLEEGLSIIVSSREHTGDLWHAHYGAGAIAAYFWVQGKSSHCPCRRQCYRRSKSHASPAWNQPWSDLSDW